MEIKILAQKNVNLVNGKLIRSRNCSNIRTNNTSKLTTKHKRLSLATTVDSVELNSDLKVAGVVSNSNLNPPSIC